MASPIELGDLITIGYLVHSIYKQCFVVARDAPGEFKLLLNEITTLESSISLLKEELGNPESILVRSGEDRVKMIKVMLDGLRQTLEKMQKVANNYEKLLNPSKKKRSLKQMWEKLKLSNDASDIDALRNKLVYHNGVIVLLLTSAGGSSLQRIETQNKKMEEGIKEIKEFLWKSRDAGSANTKQDLDLSRTVVSAMKGDHERARIRITSILKTNAQIVGSWSTIGINEWINAGGWWLLKYQMEMRAMGNAANGTISTTAYTSLLKASWILTDLITCHPQYSLLDTTIQSESEALNEAILEELRKIADRIPRLEDLDTSELFIWERGDVEESRRHEAGTESATQLQLSSLTLGLGVDNHQVIYQEFGQYQHSTGRRVPCFIQLIVHKYAQEAKLSLFNQALKSQAEVTLSPASRGTCQCNDKILFIDGQSIVLETAEDVQVLHLLICSWVEYVWWYRPRKKRHQADTHLIKVFAIMFAFVFKYRKHTDISDNSANDLNQLITLRDASGDRLGLIHETKILEQEFNGLLGEEIRKELTNGREGLFPCMERNRVDRLGMNLVYTKAELSELPDNGWRQFVHSLSEWSKISTEFFQQYNSSNVEEENSLRPAILFTPYWNYLLMASEIGNRVVVYTLLQAHVPTQHTPRSGWERQKTPLQIAAAKGFEDIVIKLLESKAEVNSLPADMYSAFNTKIHMTALQAAAYGGHEGIVRKLLEAGANVNAPAATLYGGRTALQAAAEKGHEAIVQILLDSGAKLNEEPSESEGRAALQAAAGAGNANMVKKLLQAGADVNLKPARRSGRTALQAAAEIGNEEIVRMLLQARADVNSSPAPFEGLTALQAAAVRGHENTARLLIQAGADVNANEGDTGGMTALRAAVHGGYESLVDLFLDNGAEMSAQSAPGSRTALQEAARMGHYELVEKFLKLGVDLNTEISVNRRTALQEAAGSGNDRIVRKLIESGANINVRPKGHGGITALQAAVRGGHGLAVKALLDHGAEVNTARTSQNDYTPLEIAAEGGHLDIVRMLLEAKADVNAASGFRLSALRAAKDKGYKEIVELLEPLVKPEELVSQSISRLGILQW